MTLPKSPADEVITFGQHAGTLFKDIPIGYLRWMVNAKTKQYLIAYDEITRRGELLVKPAKARGLLRRAGYNTPRGYAE